jgi:hypothetical protein
MTNLNSHSANVSQRNCYCEQSAAIYSIKAASKINTMDCHVTTFLAMTTLMQAHYYVPRNDDSHSLFVIIEFLDGASSGRRSSSYGRQASYCNLSAVALLRRLMTACAA